MSGAKLYRHFAEDGTLLYVGVSTRAGRRQYTHLQGSAWADRIARIELENFDTLELATRAERQAIAKENPLYNKRHKSGRFDGNLTMVSVRLAEGLLVELDRVAFENKLNRTGAVTLLLEEALSNRGTP